MHASLCYTAPLRQIKPRRGGQNCRIFRDAYKSGVWESARLELIGSQQVLQCRQQFGVAKGVVAVRKAGGNDVGGV